jgi:hypothetical protein
MLKTLEQRADQKMTESLPKLRADETAVFVLLQPRLSEEVSQA